MDQFSGISGSRHMGDGAGGGNKPGRGMQVHYRAGVQGTSPPGWACSHGPAIAGETAAGNAVQGVCGPGHTLVGRYLVTSPV